jgi:HTH-type transcriptional regulator / antitoxin HigA
MATQELRYQPDHAVPPGESLRSTLTAIGMTQSDLAARTGLSLKHVNQMIHGAAPITPETALLLEKATAVPARFWNTREAAYRERLARTLDRETLAQDAAWLKQLPIKELEKRGFVTPGADTATKLEQVCQFFRVANRAAWERVWLAPLAVFRRSQSFRSDEAAVATWLRLGEIEANEIECQPFDAKRFRDTLKRIRQLSREEPTHAGRELRRLCAAAGVAVAFVPEVKGARASGAARWLTPTKAMIQLSLRYKSDDHLWFSFFHEAGHILLHSKKRMFVTGKGFDNVAEEEANAFAASILIPRQFEDTLRALRTNTEVTQLARNLGIAPGIIVGRLQKEEIWDWSQGNGLKQKLKLIDDSANEE